MDLRFVAMERLTEAGLTCPMTTYGNDSVSPRTATTGSAQSPEGGTPELTLVLGATGKTGRRVAKKLTERGLTVREAGRTGTPPFHWQDPDTWAAALSDVDAVYLVYSPDIGTVESVEEIEAFTRQATEAGVRRVVMLSGRAARSDLVSTERLAQEAEDVVREASVEWTILRPGWFYQNFDEGAFAEDISNGELALPTGEGREYFVDAEDIADVAVAALLDCQHHGKTYEVGGPRPLSFREAIEEISAATRHTVRYVPLSDEEYVRRLTEAGAAVGDAQGMVEILGQVRRGGLDYPADGVQQALGREPRDFADYVKAAVANGAWAS